MEAEFGLEETVISSDFRYTRLKYTTESHAMNLEGQLDIEISGNHDILPQIGEISCAVSRGKVIYIARNEGGLEFASMDLSLPGMPQYKIFDMKPELWDEFLSL